MKLWIAVHKRIGICLPISRGATKRQIEAHIKYAAGLDAENYTVERFELTPVKKQRKAVTK